MRLLLDAHLSGARIAEPLRGRGHDVLAADEEREFDGWADEALLALASDEERVLVTFNVKDFPDIVRRWAEAGRTPAGCAIVVGIDHSVFGTILGVLESLFEERSDPAEWSGRTYFVARGERS